MLLLDSELDDSIRQIARRTRTIAVVGFSANPERPSWGVARYLHSQGYRVIPVNPGLAGQKILGEPVYMNLRSIPDSIRVDMVDIFRRSEAVPAIVDEALAVLPGLQTIWMQLGVVNAAAAAKARDRGLAVVMDRCPKIEFPRFG